MTAGRRWEQKLVNVAKAAPVSQQSPAVQSHLNHCRLDDRRKQRVKGGSRFEWESRLASARLWTMRLNATSAAPVPAAAAVAAVVAAAVALGVSQVR